MRRTHERTAPIPEPTRRIRAPRAAPVAVAACEAAQRLALFITGVDRARADELLSGLAAAARKSAVEFAREALGWDSATRQGRMAVAFGNHPRASERLKALIADASPALRAAVFRRLAPWQQSLFPRLKDTLSAAPPVEAMDALAERLIREATR